MPEPPSENAPAAHAGLEAARPPEVARLLIDECFGLWRARLCEIGRTSLELATDLFDGNPFVGEKEVEDFRARRSDWLARFDRAIREIHERRMSGTKRKGRRPDFDASLATLRVLNAFDHEKQAALTAAASFLVRHTRNELAALDLRIDELLPGSPPHAFDNPFSPDYLLDAVGVASRATWPNPRVWRPVMERVVADFTPAANKLYITLNRLLADRGVLPEIKALLRARSEHRPVEDKELVPTFSRMLADAVPAAVVADVAVPALAVPGSAAPAFDFDRLAKSSLEPVAAIVPSALAPAAEFQGGEAAPLVPAPAILSGLTELAAQAQAAQPARPEPAEGAFPDLDPLMALGTQTPLVSTLGSFQRIDLPQALADAAQRADAAPAGAVVPWNLIPHIRAAIEAQIANPGDRVTMDVIALVFDYIFRDPSIPAEERRLFQRLQVPVVKAAILDRAFFSDAAHPARRLLDQLAESAVASTQDEAYRQAFEAEAEGVIGEVCRDFEVDVDVFGRASGRLARFMEAERRRTMTDAAPERDQALASEENDADGTAMRALVRDRLAGVELPFEVRSFVETTWVDYLAAVRRDKGETSTEWIAARHTLDDLLWSIAAKERASQKARLTRMIPGLIASLRKGVVAQQVPAERAKAFFDLIYRLHVAAIRGPTATGPKPGGGAAAVAPPAAPVSAAAEGAQAAAEGARVAADAPAPPDESVVRPTIRAPRGAVALNVHDFVDEMVVGTWLSFRSDDGTVTQGRLSWVSPARTKYLFTSRARSRALILTPEELAWRLGTGRAQLVLEPVPLFDRAVSAALDTLAAHGAASRAA